MQEYIYITSIRLKPDQRALIEQIARREDLSMSQVLRRALRIGLANLESGSGGSHDFHKSTVSTY